MAWVMYLPLIALLNSGSVVFPVFAYSTSRTAPLGPLPIIVTNNSIPVGDSMERTGVWKSDTHDGIGPLYGIDAASPDDAWAVGKSSSTPSRALAVRWDGAEWGVAYWLSDGNGNNVFNDVKAISFDNVWAVGASNINVPSTPTGLIAHWNGLTWSFVDTGFDLYGTQFKSIDASSADNIWIVGGKQPLHWDGTKWEWINSRDPLGSISVLAADNVWGTGSGSILHWDGKTWTDTYKREPSKGYLFINKISMRPNGTGWAAGSISFIGNMTNGTNIVLLRWDGTSWNESQMLTYNWYSSYIYQQGPSATNACCSAIPGPSRAIMLENFGVLNANDIYAVGGYLNEPMILHRDGAKWTSDECPGGEPDVRQWISPMDERASGLFGPLHGVAEVKEGVAWAAGETVDGRGYVLDLSEKPCRVMTPTASSPSPTHEPGK